MFIIYAKVMDVQSLIYLIVGMAFVYQKLGFVTSDNSVLLEMMKPTVLIIHLVGMEKP